MNKKKKNKNKKVLRENKEIVKCKKKQCLGVFSRYPLKLKEMDW